MLRQAFPLDDATLAALSEACRASELAEFMWRGVQEVGQVLMGEGETWQFQVRIIDGQGPYTHEQVIAALVAEVQRLRRRQPQQSGVAA